MRVSLDLSVPPSLSVTPGGPGLTVWVCWGAATLSPRGLLLPPHHHGGSHDRDSSRRGRNACPWVDVLLLTPEGSGRPRLWVNPIERNGVLGRT